VKPTPPSAAAKRIALAVVLFGEGALVSEGRAARLTQAVMRRVEGDAPGLRRGVILQRPGRERRLASGVGARGRSLPRG